MRSRASNNSTSSCEGRSGGTAILVAVERNDEHVPDITHVGHCATFARVRLGAALDLRPSPILTASSWRSFE